MDVLYTVVLELRDETEPTPAPEPEDLATAILDAYDQKSLAAVRVTSATDHARRERSANA